MQSRRGPLPVFADDVPPRRLVKPFEASTMTSFEHGSAPVLSEAAGQQQSSRKKQFGLQQSSALNVEQQAADADRWKTTAQGGQIADPERKVHGKRHVRPPEQKRLPAYSGQAPASQVDKRIASFARSYMNYATLPK